MLKTSKTSFIKVIALAFLLYSDMSHNGIASSYITHEDKFANCIADSSNYRKECYEICSDRYQPFSGYTLSQDTRRCNTIQKPWACFCNYRVHL